MERPTASLRYAGPASKLARWTAGPGQFAATLPAAPTVARVAWPAACLSVVAAICGGLMFAFAPAAAASDSAGLYVAILLGICGVALARSAEPLWCVLRHRGGASIAIEDGLLSIHDQSDASGPLTVSIDDVRDVSLCAFGALPYAPHRILVRVARRSGGLIERRFWAGDATWVGPLEADLRAALNLPGGRSRWCGASPTEGPSCA